MNEELQQYIDKCKELAAKGEYTWWARLAEILSTFSNTTVPVSNSPGWPDPLESPQAEAIRNGKLDDTEIRNLFDCMERELRLHRERAANQAQVTDAMVKAIKAKWAAMRQLGDPNEHALASAAIAAIGAGGQAVAWRYKFRASDPTWTVSNDKPSGAIIEPLYTHPADERVVEDERIRRGMEEILKEQSERDIPFAPVSAKEGR